MGSCLSTHQKHQLEDSSAPNLPSEIWLKILQYLSWRDLCSVALVSKFLYTVASDHTLWSERSLNNIRKIKNVSVSVLFAVPRFNQIKSLNLTNLELQPEQWCGILEFLKTTTIEELCLRFLDLRKVSGKSLGNCVSNLKEVNMEGAHMSISQLEPFLKSISESTVLEEMNLFDMVIETEADEDRNATTMANLVTDAVVNLRSVNISYELLHHSRIDQFYTTETLTNFFEKCLHSTSLKELHCRLDVSEIPCDLFSKALCHLHKANFSFNTLIYDQVEALLDQMKALLQQNLHMSALRHLSLLTILHQDQVTLPQFLSPALLGNFVSKLESIFIPSGFLTDDQITALLCASNNSSTLTSINLSHGDLTNIRILPETTCHLQSLNLQHTCLSSHQTIAILEASLDSRTLKQLNLWNIELSEVPPVLLSQAVCRLRKVRLGSLTLYQCNHVLTSILSSGTLKDLALFSENIHGVTPHLIGRTVAHLQNVNLEFNDLSREQLSSILANSLRSQTLMEARLSHTNLDTLEKIFFLGTPRDLLTDAKRRFKASDLLNQKVVKGRDWGREPYDVDIKPTEEDGGNVGVVVKTRLEFAKNGFFWSQQAKGLVSVVWDNGNYGVCRIGRGNFYDVKLSPFNGIYEWLQF